MEEDNSISIVEEGRAVVPDPQDKSNNNIETDQPEEYFEGNAGDGTTRADQVLYGSKYYLCLLSIMICTVLVSMDMTIMMAALTSITNDFAAFNKLEWLTAAYMLPTASTGQFWGRISIGFGRKWSLVLGIIIFELGSLVCGLARSMDTLIGGRAVQGFGAAGILTVCMIIATEVSPMEKRPFAFGFIMISTITSTATGPLIGGALCKYTTWRWCFWLNLLCAAVALPFLLYSYRPRSPTLTLKEKFKTIDVVGHFLLVVSLMLIVLAVSFGQNYGWKYGGTISCFVLGAVLLVVFGYWNSHSEYPALPLDIITHYQIWAAGLSFAGVFSAFGLALQFISIYTENIIGRDSFHTGVVLVPFAITVPVISIVVAVLISKTKQLKLFSVLGSAICIVGSGLLQLYKVHISNAMLMGLQVVLAVGAGINAQSPGMSAQLLAPKSPGSTILVTAFINLCRCFGLSLFSEVGGAIYSCTLAKYVMHVSLEETTVSIESILINTALIADLNDHDKLVIRSAMLASMKDVFWLMLAVSGFGLVCSLFMSNVKLQKETILNEPEQAPTDKV